MQKTLTLTPIIYTFLFLLMILALAYIASFKGDEFSQDNAVYYMTGILGAIAFVTLVGSFLLKQDFPQHRLFLHAPVFITIYLIVLYGIPGVMGFLDPKLVSMTNELVTINYVYGAAGWLLVLIGVICLWFGYRLGLNGMMQSAPQERPLPRLTPILTLWLITVGLRLISAVMEGTGWGLDTSGRGVFLSLFNNTIIYMLSGRYLVIVVLTVLALRQRSARWILLLVLSFEIANGLITAFTSQIWFIVVTYILTYLCYGRGVRFSPLKIVGVLLLLSILIISTPIAERLRTLTYDTKSFNGIVDGVITAAEETWGQGIDYGLEIFQRRMFGRQASVAQMPGIIFQKTPSQIAYQGFEEFLALPTYLLPRFIWSSKPILSSGVWFSITYLNYPTTTDSSSAPMIFGDAYMFSGELTLVLGMFAFGFILALIYRVTVNRGLPFLCIAIVHAYIHIEGQLTTLAVAAVQTTLVMFLFYFILVISDARKNALPASLSSGGSIR